MTFPDSPQLTPQPTTLRQLLNDSVRVLAQAGVSSPEVDARELLMHALGLSRAALLMRGQENVTQPQAQAVRALMKQRAARIPLQHLLGQIEWGGVQLKTDSRALVPRPETEWLLDLALRLGQDAPRRVLDIGTGTGALALGLKKALPTAEIWATDLSSQALELARENAALNALDVHFVCGSLSAGVAGPFDLVISNPPYLPEADRLCADPEVRHDPDLALYSGVDGLALPRQLVAEVRPLLSPAGALLLELDPRNVAQLAAEMLGWQVEILPDATGRRRFLQACLRPAQGLLNKGKRKET